MSSEGSEGDVGDVEEDCVVQTHPTLTGMLFYISLCHYGFELCVAGEVCEPDADVVGDGSQPQGWYPFADRTQFEVADFLYRRVQMSAGNIDTLMELWERSSTTSHHDNCAPFPSCEAMYQHIDAIPYSKLDWQSFTLLYGDESDDPEAQPAWMEDPQVVWYRDPLSVLRSIIANPAFDGSFDYVPYHEYRHGVHCFQNFMSGDWAWKQAVSIFFFIYSAVS